VRRAGGSIAGHRHPIREVPPGDSGDAGPADVLTTPTAGACRSLQPEDVRHPSNASPVVACTEEHTAETFAVGGFPASVVGSGRPDDARLASFVHARCQPRFHRFLGGDESTVLRSTVTWVWFRPTSRAWSKGAHWWRCDVVGGGAESTAYTRLPRTAEGLLRGRPDDRWLACVDGPSVDGAATVPCSRPHTWRAVTTIVLGGRGDAFPGDRLVAARTRDFCSDSVGGWLSYPVDYVYGYTYFHEAEWKAGNRRSICWARTTR
jgi:hypothetical protein